MLLLLLSHCCNQLSNNTSIYIRDHMYSPFLPSLWLFPSFFLFCMKFSIKWESNNHQHHFFLLKCPPFLFTGEMCLNTQDFEFWELKFWLLVDRIFQCVVFSIIKYIHRTLTKVQNRGIKNCGEIIMLKKCAKSLYTKYSHSVAVADKQRRISEPIAWLQSCHVLCRHLPQKLRSCHVSG